MGEGNIQYAPAYEEVVRKVLDIFAEIDERTEALRAATGLSCPEGCGRCCEQQDLEVTVLEFMPLAVHLWKTGMAESWLEKIEKKQDNVCVFYEPDPAVKGNGRCSVYAFRGMICRLFGYFAVRDKNSVPRFAACRVMKERCPEKVENVQKLISSGFDVPLAGMFSYRVMSLDPYFGARFYPVNRAIRTAIEKMGYLMSLEVGS